jgi:DNA polymerase III subunit delta'
MNNPASLWIGNKTILKKTLISFLQNQLCPQNGCKNCHECTKINELQHHALMWINPEKQYTLAHLEPVFECLAFKNDEKQKYFFILDKADTLTPPTANSLLKSVEEPPNGYHFIFLAQRIENILPTIRSRCIIKKFHDKHEELLQKVFLEHFKIKTDPLAFLQELDNVQLHERESLELIDNLLNYWNKKFIENSNSNIKKIITCLQMALTQPPMPGSSKIFWKNLYLQINKLLTDV